MKKQILMLSLFVSIITVCLCVSCHNLFVNLVPKEGNTITTFTVPGQTAATFISANSIQTQVGASTSIDTLLPFIQADEGAVVLPITWEYLKAAIPFASPDKLVKDWVEAKNKASWILKVLKDNPNFTIPAIDKPINFSAPVMIAVISAQGVTRLYTVILSGGAIPVPEPSDQNKILSFSVPAQIGTSTIRHNAPASVEFSVAQNTDVRSVIPSVTLSEQALPLPLTFEYLRRSFPTTDIYELFLAYYLAPDKAHFLREKIKQTPDYVAPPKILDIPIDFSSPVPFAILAWDNTIGLYTVTAKQLQTDAQIKMLSFSKALNPELVRDAVATINEETKTINVTAWLPAEYTATKRYKASFRLAGDETPGETSLYLVSGSTETLITNNITEVDCASSPLTLRAKRSIAGLTEQKDYTLVISTREDPNTIRSITDFRFNKVDNPSIASNTVAAIYDSGDTGIISITVPYTGTIPPATLKCSFISGGVVSDTDLNPLTSGTVIPTPEISELICTSKDASKRRVYILKIDFLPVTGSVEPRLQNFKFSSFTNDALFEDAVGKIDDTSETVFAQIKYTTSTAPRQLIPEFTASGVVSVDGIIQTPGITAQDFTHTQTYTVTSPFDPSITKTYRVQLVYTAASSSACELLSLKFLRSRNPSLRSDVEAVIDSRTGFVSVLFPYGTNHTATPLIADFTAAGTVSKDGKDQLSGISTGLFTDGTVFTVQSADKTHKKTYTMIAQERSDTIYVNSTARGRNNGVSWEDAYISLNAAINARSIIPSSTPVNIYIAASGEYKPPLNTSFNITANTALYGGFDGTETAPADRETITVSDGKSVLKVKTALKGNGNRVLFLYPSGYDIYLDGLEISGGFYTGGGAGVSILEEGIVHISQCDFKNNDSLAGGSAVFSTAFVKITDSSFTANTGTIAVYLRNGADITGSTISSNNGLGLILESNSHSSTITNSFINENKSTGAHIYGKEATPVIVSNCEFRGNTSSGSVGGGAMFENANVKDCNFISNKALEGGGAVTYGGSFINCTFSNNSTIHGGGLYVITTTAGINKIIGCTFSNNSATFGGGLKVSFRADNAQVTLSNSYFSGNAAPYGPQLYVTAHSDESAYYSGAVLTGTATCSGLGSIYNFGGSVLFN